MPTTDSQPRVVTRPISVDLSKAPAASDASRLAPIASRYLSPTARKTAPQSRNQKMAVIGSSKQPLFALPGEVDSLYVPSAEIQRQTIQQALEKRFLVMSSETDRRKFPKD